MTMLVVAVPSINHDEEEADGDLGEEKDLGEIEKHKTVILHLLSQLKLGMDLTRVIVCCQLLSGMGGTLKNASGALQYSNFFY